MTKSIEEMADDLQKTIDSDPMDILNKTPEQIIDEALEYAEQNFAVKSSEGIGNCYECTRDGDTCDKCKEKELKLESDRLTQHND